MLKKCAVLAATVSIATSGAIAVAGPAQASTKTSTARTLALSLPSAPTRVVFSPNDSSWD